MLMESTSRLEGKELEQHLERAIAQRTMGRIRQLRVEVFPDRMAVHGYTSSYYVKQLALQAILELSRAVRTPRLDLNVEVGMIPSYTSR